MNPNNNMKSPKVVAIVLCTNEIHHLEDCFASLKSQSYKNLEVYLLDNNSSDGSVEYTEKNFPEVHILEFGENLGYSVGNNRGMKEAFENGADLVLVINSDIKADERMVEQLVRTYQDRTDKGDKVGLIQPVILLFDDPTKLNSVGNAIHYLGFGYCKDYMKPYTTLESDLQIASVSGAAMLVPREFYEDIGVINEDFFIYNEDQNYSWRGLLKGYKHFVSAKATMLHKYRYKSYPFKMYHSEKNRVMIVLENYELKTLILLIPIWILNELLLLVHSILYGWFVNRLKAWWYDIRNISYILKVRKQIQSSRTVKDKVILGNFVTDLDFEATNNKLIDNVVSPIYNAYFKLINKLL